MGYFLSHLLQCHQEIVVTFRKTGNFLSMPTDLQTGYCTNVHAGADFRQTKQNLQQHALSVRELYAPNSTMGVGLWLANSAAETLVAGKELDDFALWLADVGLVPFTLNGFPFGDFHKEVVKHDVYLPTWWEPERLQYTKNLIKILDRILPSGMMGTISTLPIAWGNPYPSQEQLHAAAMALQEIAGDLDKLHKQDDRTIVLCLEPEPGCVLQRSKDVVEFFEKYLLPGQNEKIIRKHIQVCHDVCHQFVMFEGQKDVLQRYLSAGIGVGKVQVSSAVHLPMSRIGFDQHSSALNQLGEFAEHRYLHQTMVQTSPETAPEFCEDLALALAKQNDYAGEKSDWRVHFHVPIYLKTFGSLHTSQNDICECLDTLLTSQGCSHFEVETYAWSVLPKELQHEELATGIAQEMHWLSHFLSKSTL